MKRLGNFSRKLSRNQEIRAFLNASRAILKHASFEDAARAIFDETRGLTGAVSGYVALMSEDGRENEVLFLEAGGLDCDVDPELPMPIRGLREVAYRTRNPVFDNDFARGRWQKFLPVGHVTLHNVMFVPLNIGDKTLGVMGLANKPKPFNRRDLEIGAALGDLCAVALSNSRNLDRLREIIQEQKQLLSKIKTLEGLLPICAQCKKIRDDDRSWQTLEEYLSQKTTATISHGLCPDCGEALYQSYIDLEKGRKED